MHNFFYHFFNKPLGYELFSRDAEDGTPAPATSQERITQDSIVRITEDGQERITE
jgi:hypothetical protein